MTLRLNGATSGYTEIDAPAVAGSNTLVLPTGAGSANQFLKNGSTAGSLGWSSLVEDSAGRCGIGTSSPNSVLHIEAPEGTAQLTIGNTALAASDGDFLAGIDFHIKDNNDATGAVCTSIRSIANQNHTLTAKGTALAFSTTTNDTTTLTERLRIDQAGRVGIGTTSPSVPLHVLTSTTNTPGLFEHSGSVDSYLYLKNSTGGAYIASRTNDLSFHTSAAATERMRIQADGQIRVTNNNTNIVYVNTGANGTALCYFQTASAELGKIRINGAGVAYDTTSDYRLKENVEPITDATLRVQALKPWRFNFISHPDVTVDGFLAHETQEVVPEAVGGTKDEVDDEGNPVYQGIDQSKLVPLLTAALQEAIAKIESLEARLTALEVTP